MGVVLEPPRHAAACARWCSQPGSIHLAARPACASLAMAFALRAERAGQCREKDALPGLTRSA